MVIHPSVGIVARVFTDRYCRLYAMKRRKEGEIKQTQDLLNMVFPKVGFRNSLDINDRNPFMYL